MKGHKKVFNNTKHKKMPKIICIASQKGGVGKSTLCLNLACMFKENLKVGLLDLDLQSSSSDLLQGENEIELISKTTGPGELQSLPSDILFIDTPPYLSGRLIEILSVADAVLIPTRAGVFDAMALSETVQLVQQVQETNRRLNAAIVFTMVKTGSTIAEEIKPVLNTGNIKLLDVMISERISFARSLLTGGVFTSSDYKAKMEVMALADEVVALLGL